MPKKITNDVFDELFDSGESVSDYVDWDNPIDVPVSKKIERTTIDLIVALVLFISILIFVLYSLSR